MDFTVDSLTWWESIILCFQPTKQASTYSNLGAGCEGRNGGEEGEQKSELHRDKVGVLSVAMGNNELRAVHGFGSVKKARAAASVSFLFNLT